MAPIDPVPINKTTERPKSWKKINAERKELRKKRKQEKLLKSLEEHADLARLAKIAKENATATKEKPSTISIAVPSSILENAQSAELRTYVAGQIARAACIFCVDEVIVFDDVVMATARETKRNYDTDEEAQDGSSSTVRSSCLQLSRILQYLECPQYLRKFFFPLHKDLKYAGLLNPLDAPHHLRQQNAFLYREGIISEKKAKEGYSYVNVGLFNEVLVNKALAPGVRVTVKLDPSSGINKKQRATIVSPDEPRCETGVYWGYSVRIAHSLSEIFTKSPYEDGYDLTIGTSDRGGNVHEVPQKSLAYNHLLIVFGGLMGLEAALANDDNLTVDDPELLFNHYVNVLPKQGSRTIRTEEALLVALAALQEKLQPNVPVIEEDLTKFLPRSEDTGLTLPPPMQKFSKKKKRKFSEKNDEESPQRSTVAITSQLSSDNESLVAQNKAPQPRNPKNKFRRNEQEANKVERVLVPVINNPFKTKKDQDYHHNHRFEKNQHEADSASNANNHFRRNDHEGNPLPNLKNKFRINDSKNPRNKFRCNDFDASNDSKRSKTGENIVDNFNADDLEVVPTSHAIKTNATLSMQDVGDLSRFD